MFLGSEGYTLQQLVAYTWLVLARQQEIRTLQFVLALTVCMLSQQPLPGQGLSTLVMVPTVLTVSSDQVQCHIPLIMHNSTNQLMPFAWHVTGTRLGRSDHLLDGAPPSVGGAASSRPGALT